MADMVRRDRHHPGIVAWSLCNEIECTELTPNKSAEFRAAVLAVDSTRVVTANLLHDSSGSLIPHLDLTGVSHSSTIPAPWTPTPAGMCTLFTRVFGVLASLPCSVSLPFASEAIR